MRARALILATVMSMAVLLSGCSGLRHFADPIEPPTAPRTSTPPPAQPASRHLRDRHLGADVFTGTVTGYTRRPGEEVYGCDDVTCVRVDSAVVLLDMIVPFGVSCDDSPDDDEQQAERAKEHLLPVGTRVRVVRDEPGGDSHHDYDGMIHIAADYDPAEPFAGSANELLVRGGYWVPDDSGFNTGAVGGGYDRSYRSDIATADLRSILPVQAGYIPRIVKAANRARLKGAGGQMICVLQLVEAAREDAAMRARVDADNRRISAWWVRYVAAHPEVFRCRDGDGDGVCHER